MTNSPFVALQNMLEINRRIEFTQICLVLFMEM
jgi:hypothetical protein